MREGKIAAANGKAEGHVEYISRSHRVVPSWHPTKPAVYPAGYDSLHVSVLTSDRLDNKKLGTLIVAAVVSASMTHTGVITEGCALNSRTR